MEEIREEVRQMINSLGGIGSYQSLFSTQTSSSTSQTVTSFDDVLQTTGQSETEQTASAGGSGGAGGSSGTNSEMDLNNDGQVTIDEIMRYLEMQQQNNEFEQAASEEGSQQMAQENNNISGIDDFKTLQASRAYISSETILSQVTEMLTESFFG